MYDNLAVLNNNNMVYKQFREIIWLDERIIAVD